jgi:hypothetical protein
VPPSSMSFLIAFKSRLTGAVKDLFLTNKADALVKRCRIMMFEVRLLANLKKHAIYAKRSLKKSESKMFKHGVVDAGN